MQGHVEMDIALQEVRLFGALQQLLQRREFNLAKVLLPLPESFLFWNRAASTHHPFVDLG